MSYEKLRNEIAATRLQSRSSGDVAAILAVIDQASSGYEITKKSTDLIVAEEFPQIIKMYVASLAVENKSRCTTEGYLRTLRAFFDSVRKPFDAVTTNDIRAYLYAYQQQRGVKNSSLDHIRTVINGFYAWCVREEYLIRNPVAKIAKIKSGPVNRPRMTALELETLRHACSTPREKALVDVLYSTGIRVSELTALQKKRC